METWQIWLIAALLAAVFELFTFTLVSLCIALACAAAAIAAFVGTATLGQFGVFAGTLVVAFVALFPFAKKLKANKKAHESTNIDAIVGRTGTVVEEIVPAENKGRVSLDGTLWPAKSAAGTVIPAGTQVVVVENESIVLVVEEK